MTPEEARARVALGNRLCSGGPDVPTVDGRVGAVPTRTYGPDHRGGTLVYAHGGGWVTGDLEYADQLCRHLAGELDLRVVSVDYRLAPEHPWPACLDDLATVWSAVRQDPGWCGLGGDSAGAHLAAVLSHSTRRRPGTGPDALLLIYPALGPPGATESYTTRGEAFPTGAADMRWFWDHLVGGTAARGSLAGLFPSVASDLVGTPPTHVVLAGHDPLHDEGAAYATRLRAAGVPVTVSDHPTLCHGFLRMTGASGAARDALAALVPAVGRLMPPKRAAGAHEGIHAYDSAPTGPLGPATHSPRESP